MKKITLKKLNKYCEKHPELDLWGAIKEMLGCESIFITYMLGWDDDGNPIKKYYEPKI